MRYYICLLLFILSNPLLAQENLPDRCFAVAGEGGANGGNDLAILIDPTGRNLVSNETNIGEGTGTELIEAVAIQPGTGIIFAANADRLGTIDVNTGVFTPVSANTFGAGNGRLGTIDFNDVDGLSFDPASIKNVGSLNRNGWSSRWRRRLEPKWLA